jgi:hypothetical protein
MVFDLGKSFSAHVNGYHFNNFALGFDYYQVYDEVDRKIAGVVILSFLFFNIAITRWTLWTSKNS